MEKEILYRKGTRVWLPDPEHVWVGGTLQEDYNEKQLTVELEDGTVVDVDLAKGKQLPPLRNPEILVGANDLTSLSYLHEPAVLHNLRERFLTQNEIYTYCGIVLVALNPYADIQIYGPEMATAYSGVSIGEMDPHIFAVAEDAFRSMVDDGKNQSIIVSGESGAGKTVSAKYTMRYFAYVGGSTTETAIEHKVLASNPILEAIGNAKTIRNDNSSRFGKYIEINFDENNHISGAHMRTYLLEKSRVIYQAPNERNYHIFYQLCSSRGLQELQELNLKDPNEFYYTQQGEAPIISGVDDEQCFQETSEAMAVLGIYSEQQRMIWRILAAILHLGNINIISTSKSGESCHVKVDDFHAVMVSSLLGVNLNQLCKWLCARKIIATGDVYVKPLTYKESNNGRDALAKYIYSQLFDWIVEHVNSNLAVTTVRKSFIGVLDIYGFETFDVNSFEQFCINYANEKLQQQFNQHVFKLEQEEYIKEQITWSFIDFYDNQPCLDLIEMKIGILDLLDEECRMPKGSDESWARKMYKEHIQKSKHFVKPRLSDKAFIVRHYADDVIYDCNGFVEKNRDSINEEHLQLLKASEYELVGELFNSQENTSAFVPRKRTSSRVGKHAPKGKKTVGSQFRDSLRSLMDALNSTSPHYVRCIKSNDEKSSFELDMKRCVQQLRACGVLETIRISAAGYPSRWTYKEFFDRYRMLISWKQINWDSLHGTCQTILTSLIHDDDKFQFGKTKIFFRAGQVAYLERLRSDKLRESCITIQKNIKSWLVYRHYRKLKKSTITIQCWVRSYQARRYVQFLRETKAATKIQSCWRRFVCYKSYQETYTFIIFVQAHIRGLLVRQRLTAFIREKKSIVIQKSWRGYTARREYKKIRRAVILAQCCVRRRAAKKEFKRLKIEARSVEHLKSLTKGMELKVIALQQKLTDEQNERKSLQQQLSTVTTMEDEILKLKELRPLYNELLKVNKELQANNEGLTTNNNKLIEENNALKEKLEITNKEKDEELKTTKSSLVLLRETVTNQKQKLEMVEAEDEATLTQKLKEQKEQLLLEFNSERASHQKMIGEYARLEQRFMNLQEELKIEKASPDKRRRKSTLNAQAEEDLIVEDENPEGRISSITADLFDVTRERDQLLEQVELLKEEHNISLNLSKNTEQPAANSSTEIMKANQTLKEEKDSLEKELNILRQAIVDGEEKSLDKQDRVMSKLLEQIKELRKENAYLKKQLEKQSVDETIPVPSNYNNNGNINDVAEKEISRVTLENITLKEENEHIRAQLKDALSRSITSPPKRTNSFTKKLEKGLGPRSKSNVSELYRNRTPSGIDQNNLSDSGRLFMTYAGLMRKRPGSFGKLNSPNGNVMPSKLGMLKFTAENQEEIINKLILSMDSNHVEKEVPGLPAHIIFMGVRYIDYINDERLMQSFLTAAITAIKKCVTKTAGDIDTQAFWLSNSFRLCCDMKQYSGDQQYQSMNTREQNMQCLVNFDLSEYRQVLADACIKIYQDMVSTIQKRINNLIVAGMLEYESIPGIISTTKRFKSERKASEEIITVKDITNKLSAILAVLNAHCVETGLIKQIFRQIYYFINSTMMNNILLRKDMCHWSRGLQIKFNLTQLEEWCRTNQLHENYNVVEQLAPITEVVQLLQVNKKSLSDLEAILNTVTKLNALQVQKILSMYTPPNEYEPRVPANLIRAVVGRMKKEEAMFLMMDLNYISPMTTPFVPSTVNFNEVTIPEPLGMKSFEII